jgi:site-specific DNA-methyltransferase (adenine-specific)
MGALYLGDCAEVAPSLPAGQVRLIYLDPPFNTGKERVGSTRNIPLGDAAGEGARSGCRSAMASEEPHRYGDAWPSLTSDFLPWLRTRIEAMVPLLMPNGSLVLHLDARTVHYAKVMLDELLGPRQFVNEIIWHYTGGGRSRRRFSAKHDTLLWYVNKRGRFPAREKDVSPFQPKRMCPLLPLLPFFDADAVRQPYKPTSGYAKAGIVSAAGKRYQPHPAGTPVDDVWDIPIVNPLAAERCGYPTQKPLALLERLIKALSAPGDLVGDFFCGSGTTLVAAQRLGRRWVGGDLSAAAVACAQARLQGSAGQAP